MRKKVLPVALLLVLSSFLFCIGCSSEPTVDTSSEQAFVDSIAKIYKKLPEAEKVVFGKYLTAVMAGEINSFNRGERGIREGEYGEFYLLINEVAGEKAPQYLNAVNGLTAIQIQEQGKAIWVVYEAKRIEARKNFFDTSDFKKQYEGY